MVKKKLCLKGDLKQWKHRRYNSPSITRTLLEKRLQLNKSWTDRLKRPVLCRVSTYPTGDRIFWTYQQISVSTVDSISQIHNSTISLSTCTFNTKTLLRYREMWPLMLHDSKSRESNKPQKSWAQKLWSLRTASLPLVMSRFRLREFISTFTTTPWKQTEDGRQVNWLSCLYPVYLVVYAMGNLRNFWETCGSIGG